MQACGDAGPQGLTKSDIKAAVEHIASISVKRRANKREGTYKGLRSAGLDFNAQFGKVHLLCSTKLAALSPHVGVLAQIGKAWVLSAASKSHEGTLFAEQRVDLQMVSWNRGPNINFQLEPVNCEASRTKTRWRLRMPAQESEPDLAVNTVSVQPASQVQLQVSKVHCQARQKVPKSCCMHTECIDSQAHWDITSWAAALWQSCYAAECWFPAVEATRVRWLATHSAASHDWSLHTGGSA